MPGLARTLEAAELVTILVTPMPFWAERVGVPRTLAVEFPFGHTLGRPVDTGQQHRVIRQALEVLATATEPGTIVHSDEVWPLPVKHSIAAWQPAEKSPIVDVMAPQVLEIVRQQRRRKS